MLMVGCFVCSWLGKGLIKSDPDTVWEVLTNPYSRYIHDELLKVTVRHTRHTRHTFIPHLLMPYSSVLVILFFNPKLFFVF